MKKILSRISSLELKEDEMLVVKGGAGALSNGDCKVIIKVEICLCNGVCLCNVRC